LPARTTLSGRWHVAAILWAVVVLLYCLLKFVYIVKNIYRVVLVLAVVVVCLVAGLLAHRASADPFAPVILGLVITGGSIVIDVFLWKGSSWRRKGPRLGLRLERRI